MDRENFSIGAFYNINKNQDNPIKTVGRDSFLSPKPLKIQVFRGRTAPIFWGTQLDPDIYKMCPSLIEIGSKTAEKNSAQINKQTNQQTLRK